MVASAILDLQRPTDDKTLSAIEPSRFERFTTVDADLLEQRKLLRRVDTKFLVSASSLEALLGELDVHYGILYAGEASVASYETLYFDTPEVRCFHDHRRGKRSRFKVRVRHYIDRKVTYLEIKTKTNRNVTIKKRVRRAFRDNALADEDREFIQLNSGLSGEEMLPQLWTNFRRISLVGLSTNERVTIDLDLSFARNEELRSLPGVVIVEVKQSPFNRRTPIMKILRALGRRPVSMSKYCTATGLTRTDVRTSRFSETFKILERLRA